MVRIFLYIIIAAAIAILLRKIFEGNGRKIKAQKSRAKLRLRNSETWVQVYDTDSLEEVQALQARLEEEEIDCFVYEQGRKDIHGNLLKGFGIVVPRTSVSHAQKIIARMPA